MDIFAYNTCCCIYYKYTNNNNSAKVGLIEIIKINNGFIYDRIKYVLQVEQTFLPLKLYHYARSAVNEIVVPINCNFCCEKLFNNVLFSKGTLLNRKVILFNFVRVIVPVIVVTN